MLLTAIIAVKTHLLFLLHVIAGYDTKLSCAPEREPFLKCLAMGLFTNIARKALPHNQNESLARNLTRNEKYQLFQSFQNKKNPVVHNSQDIKDNCYHTLRGQAYYCV
jgi:hypothetical protein